MCWNLFWNYCFHFTYYWVYNYTEPFANKQAFLIIWYNIIDITLPKPVVLRADVQWLQSSSHDDDDDDGGIWKGAGGLIM